MPSYRAATSRTGLVLGVGLASVAVLTGVSLGAVAPPSTPGLGAGGGNNGAGVGNGPSGASAPAKALVVTHALQGAVRLGTPATLRVTVRNPNSQDVFLRSVSARVTSVSSTAGAGPACRPDDFAISTFTAPAGTRRVLKDRSTSVDLLVTMRESGTDQDRCKGATYTFSYAAAADQA